MIQVKALLWGKYSEGFGIDSSCGVSRTGAFNEDLLREWEDSRTAESGSRIRIPGDSEEVQIRTEVEFTREVCDEINQKIYRAAVSKYENSGIRELPTEEKIIERSVESCGPYEHHAVEKDFVLSPESEELSDEQLDDDYLFGDVSDTDFSDVEELEVNLARNETSFGASLNSVACDNKTAIARNFGGGFKASRKDMLGAWGLMELKTGGLEQKFCIVTHVADETQMRKTECSVDTFENWTSSGEIHRQLVSEMHKGQNDKAAGDGSYADLNADVS